MRKIKVLLSWFVGMILCLCNAQAGHWTCKPSDFQYDMVAYVGLQIDGAMVTIVQDYEVAAFVGDDEAFFRIRFGGYGIHDAVAVGCAVSGIDVEMQGAKTHRTVIAGCIFQRGNFMSAVFADEGVVVFCKAFCFHKLYPFV